MMKSLFLAWQDPLSRNWFPVGRLLYDGLEYVFFYTKGAKASENFKPFGVMNNLEQVYFSTDIFPLFGNRIIQKNRPEYFDFLKWIDLNESEAEPIVILERTGGKRETDTLAIFPEPRRTAENQYIMAFFVNGIKYLTPETINRIDSLNVGERLFLLKDVQNKHDAFSLVMRTDAPATLVGYCPRYLNEDFNWLLNNVNHNSIQVTVKRINNDAPLQLKLLCELTSTWPIDFHPCSAEIYQPISIQASEIINRNFYHK